MQFLDSLQNVDLQCLWELVLSVDRVEVQHFAFTLAGKIAAGTGTRGAGDLEEFAIQIMMNVQLDAVMVREAFARFCAQLEIEKLGKLKRLLGLVGAVKVNGNAVAIRQHGIASLVLLRGIEVKGGELYSLGVQVWSQVIMCMQQELMRFLGDREILWQMETLVQLEVVVIKGVSLEKVLQLPVQVLQENVKMLGKIVGIVLEHPEANLSLTNCISGLVDLISSFCIKNSADLDGALLEKWGYQVFWTFVHIAEMISAIVNKEGIVSELMSDDHPFLWICEILQVGLDLIKEKYHLFIRISDNYSLAWKTSLLRSIADLILCNDVTISQLAIQILLVVLKTEFSLKSNPKKSSEKYSRLKVPGLSENTLQFVTSELKEELCAFLIRQCTQKLIIIKDLELLQEDPDRNVASSSTKTVESGTTVNNLNELLRICYTVSPETSIQVSLQLLQSICLCKTDQVNETELDRSIIALKVCGILVSCSSTCSLCISQMFERIIESNNTFHEAMQMGLFVKFPKLVDFGREILTTLCKFNVLFLQNHEILLQLLSKLSEAVEVIYKNPDMQTNPRIVLFCRTACKSMVKLSMNETNLKIFSENASLIFQRIETITSSSGFNVGMTTLLVEFLCRVICGMENGNHQMALLEKLSSAYLGFWSSELMSSICSSPITLTNLVNDGGEAISPLLKDPIDLRVFFRSLVNCTASILNVFCSDLVPKKNSEIIFNFVTFEITQKYVNKFLCLASIISGIFQTCPIINSSDSWESSFKTDDGDFTTSASSGLLDMVSNRFDEPSARRRWLFHIRQKLYEIVGFCFKNPVLYHQLLESGEFLNMFFTSIFSDIEKLHPYLLCSIMTDILPGFCKNCPIVFYSNLLKPVLCSFIQTSVQNLETNWNAPKDDIFTANSLNECCTSFSDLLYHLVFHEVDTSNENVKSQNPFLQMICTQPDLLSLITMSSVKLLYWPVHNSRVKASRILVKLIQALSQSPSIQGICALVFESAIEILSLTSKTVEVEISRCISSVVHECLSRFQEFPQDLLLRIGISKIEVEKFKKTFSIQDRTITTNFIRANILGTKNQLGESVFSTQKLSAPIMSSSKLLKSSIADDSAIETLGSLFS